MSDEQPRMSRREMRAKGLLAPILDGASPLDDLTPTAEIRLKRLTRKEMREREAMEAHSAQSPSRSGSRPSDSPRSRSSDLTRSPEPTRRSDLSRSRSSDLTRAPEPTRRSSEGTRLGQSARAKAHAASGEPRWRHVEDDPAVVASFNEPRSDRKDRASDSGVAMPSQLSSRAADVETPEHVDERLESGPFTHSLEPRRIADSSRRDAPEEPREPTRQSVFNRFEQDASQTSGVDLAGSAGGDEPDDQELSQAASLRAPLLQRLQRESQHEDQSDSPGAPAPDEEPAESGSSDARTVTIPQAPEPIVGAQLPDSSSGYRRDTGEYDSDLVADTLEDEKPRGWLMTLIAILIGLALGVGIGLVGRYFLKSDGVQPVLEAAAATYGLPGF